MSPPSSVVQAEINGFDALADQWWDPDGPMRMLHRMNPVRIGWIDRRLRARRPGQRLRVLDVGCGAGLAAEAMAARGHEVLGIDAAESALDVARAHADGRNMTLAYRAATAEALVAEGEKFDAVMALEVIEHVAEPRAFLRSLSQLVVPGGCVFVSTLNRTPRSFLVAKLGAEYLMRLLPVGTHDWRKFVTPAELAAYGASAGLRRMEINGMVFDALSRRWRIGTDLGINYIAMLTA